MKYFYSYLSIKLVAQGEFMKILWFIWLFLVSTRLFAMSEEEKIAKNLIEKSIDNYFTEIEKHEIDKLIDFVSKKDLTNKIKEDIKNIIISDELISEEQKEYLTANLKKYIDHPVEWKMKFVDSRINNILKKEYIDMISKDLKKIYLAMLSTGMKKKDVKEVIKQDLKIFLKNNYFPNISDEKDIDEHVDLIVGKLSFFQLISEIFDLICDSKDEEILLINFIKNCVKIYHDFLLLEINKYNIDNIYKKLIAPDIFQDLNLFVQASIIYCLNNNKIGDIKILKKMFNEKELSNTYKFTLGTKAVFYLEKLLPYLKQEEKMLEGLIKNIDAFNKLLEINNNLKNMITD